MRGLAAKKPGQVGCHYNEQVHGGEMVEEEKQNGLGTMKRGRTGEVREVRTA